MQYKNPNYLNNSGQSTPITNQGIKQNVMHFAKSECPSPKQKTSIIDPATKGLTQGRFFSRKNSNSNQNLSGNMNQSISSNSYTTNGHNSQQQRHNFSPSQQNQIKIQKQLQQIQLKRQHDLNNVPKNGFALNNSNNSSAAPSRRTSQKSGKSSYNKTYKQNSVNIYSTQGHQANFSNDGLQREQMLRDSLQSNSQSIHQSYHVNPSQNLGMNYGSLKQQ